MKPTSGRLPLKGGAATMYGSESIVPAIGPLSTSLQGCKLFIKTIIDAKPWYKDPSLLPFMWKEENFFHGRKLKVGVLWNDGVVKPHPPVTRALKQVVDKLKANGNVEVVEWNPYKHDEAWEIIVSLPPPSDTISNFSRQTFISATLVLKKAQRWTRPPNRGGHLQNISSLRILT